jgi:site-specific recombinase XerD
MSLQRIHDSETGRFVSAGIRPWEVFMSEHECVQEWLEIRPLGTRKQYGRKLMHFCEETGLSPEEFLALDRRRARDVVWKYVKPFIAESTSKAKNNMAALKSFYRSQDGEILPFDSRRGGKHYFNAKKRKKAALEHVPNIPETYAIIDATTNLRDNTMLLILFQSGIRENAIYHLKFGHVQDQLYPEPKIPLRLRITDQIDTKLRGYMIDFYDTFLQGEAVQKLRAYCDAYHKDQDPEKQLFYTDLGNPMSGERVWDIVKGCVRRAGLDPKTIWVHTIRRAFESVVRHSSLDFEFKEAVMGHALEGSRENYFSCNDPQEIEQEYLKIDFGREIPESKVQKQAEEIEKLKKELRDRDKKLEMWQNYMKEQMATFDYRMKVLEESKALLKRLDEEEKYRKAEKS